MSEFCAIYENWSNLGISDLAWVSQTTPSHLLRSDSGEIANIPTVISEIPVQLNNISQVHIAVSKKKKMFVMFYEAILW